MVNGRTALLPDCLIALLPYCLTARLPYLGYQVPGVRYRVLGSVFGLRFLGLDEG
jgi:hypothetical protein